MRSARGLRWGIALLLSFSLLAGLFSAEPASAETLDELQKRVEQKTQELRTIQNRQKDIERRIRDARNQQSSTRAQIESLGRNLTATENRLQQLEEELRRAQEEVERTERELAEAEAELARRNDLLARRIRAIYEHGTVGYLEVLLSANSFSDFLSRFEQLKQIIGGDVNLLHAAEEQQKRVELKKAEVDLNYQTIAALKDEVESTREELRLSIARHQGQLQRLAEIEHSLTEDLEAMEETMRQVERDLAQYRKQYEEALNRSGAIQLAYPLPKQVRISSPFGYRTHPILGTKRLHAGTDYAASYGTQILAAESGIVMHAGWYGGYGNAVIIVHGKGIVTLYGHMSKVAVSKDQQVKKGQVIGYVGSTGQSTGPHLHFEVRVNDQPQNPQNYLGKVIP